MRFIVQVRREPDTNTIGDVIDVAVIERGVLSPATLGLSIEEAKGLLAGVQPVVATEHCADALSNVEHCEDCGRRFRVQPTYVRNSFIGMRAHPSMRTAVARSTL